MSLHTGAEVAGYRIDGVIGRGGMGIVYEATQLALDRAVALKILTATGPELQQRFRREAMLQAALDHPHVVPVYEAGESDDGMYIAMKLVRGTDLKRLAEGGSLEPERALDILAQAASALDAAHASGLVHRDVKPQNVLVGDDGTAYLADFGLTKGAADRSITATGAYSGSLDYVAPEQIRGEPAGPAADLYAFAAVLYEALTGEVVFPVDSEAALLYAHLSEPPPRPTARRPGLPAGLDGVVGRGLAKPAGERYATAGELVEAARAALASQPVSERPFGQTIADVPLARRAPVIAVEEERHIPWQTIGVVALVLLALLLGGIALGRTTAGSGHPRQSAVRSGPLALAFPTADWRTARPPAIPGLRLVSTIALVSTHGDRPGTLVAGIAPDAEGAGLLPASLRADLNGAAPAEAVAAGPLRGLYYRELPAGHVDKRFSLLLVPTPRGAAAVACLEPRVLPPDAQAADCAGVAATLRLVGLHALPLGQTGAYASALSATLTLLDGERLAGRRQLAGATRPAEESRAARVLQTGFAGAAQRLRAIQPTPFARPAHERLTAAVRRAASAYGALATAAQSDDRGAYDAAARKIDQAERALERAITAVEQLRVG